MTENNDFNNTENDSTNSRNELWKIIGEEYISYTGGNAVVISNGECKVNLWERLEDAQLFCDKLNALHEENQRLKEVIDSRDYEISELGKQRNYLVDENEQLKQREKTLEGMIRTFDEGCKEIYDDKCRLEKENEQLKNRLKDWHQKTFKAHEYFNILEKVIDEVCDDDISNQIWKEYEKGEVDRMTEKRCTDCKYTKGIGYDFWCGEGHTEYEVFMGETNCPYYEYYDWSKDTPSETNKRFKQVVDGVKDTRTGRTLTHPLDVTMKLNEINTLYDIVFDRNEELEKENEELKTTISRLIEQNRKNNDLLVSDIRLLEKALWCPNCARNIKRLKELKKEFEND